MEETITEIKHEAESENQLRFLGRNRAAGAFAFIAALAAAAVGVLTPYISRENAYCNYSDYYDGMNDRQAGVARAKYCRDMVYSDLCKLGTIYLPQCSGGVYGGKRETYEGLYAGLSRFDEIYTSQAENIFGIKNASMRALRIEQSKYTITSIDSDYYDFFVSYGDECLTNISGLEYGGDSDSVLDRLREKYPDWYYMRQGSTIRTKTKYDESGLTKTEVYYTTADKDGKPFLTSEYIDSDKLIFGACSTDNFGRYVFCFNGEGDRTIPDSTEYAPNDLLQLDSNGVLHILSDEYIDETGESVNSGYLECTVQPDSPDYVTYLAENGGAVDENGSWLSIMDMAGYTLTPVDMSGLTIFMTPKTDIVAASESFIGKHRALRKQLTIAQTVSTGAFCFFGILALLAMVFRPKEKYAADGRPLIYRPVKTDSSVLLLGAGGLLFGWSALEIADTWYVDNNINIYSVIKLACAAAASLLCAMLGAGGLVRQFKLHGMHEPKEWLAADIWRGTAPMRRRTKERFYGSALIQALRRLPLHTRQRLFRRTAEISLAALFFSAIVVDNLGDSVLVLIPIAALCLISAITYIISADRTARDIAELTKQAQDMLGSESDGGSAEIRSAANRLDISSPIYALGEKLESVSGTAEKAVEERIKSERLKIELVTNVSHDLKTPLTSMIGYLDLLEKSELPAESRDYVMILSRKADKLRDIVADVFTLAKAVSGIEVEMTELDLAMMARQVAADISDKAESSGRELKTDIQPARAPIMADGGKLYRVIQNLLDNALKYSMEGSRVYLTLTEHGGGFELEVRNVCESEPDFTAEEILERFARGDKSRTDGGSGLGLSIAKSFTEACGGSFEIVLDRDIFTAYVRFDRRNEEKKDEVVDAEIIS